MKRDSLCVRLTVMTGVILLLCSIALTLSASYNAAKQLKAVAVPVPATIGDDTELFDPERILVTYEGDPILTPIEGVASITTARRDFNLAGLAALVVISVLGTTAVYFATKHTLKPIRELNRQIAAITEHNLDERVAETGRGDEVGTLCRSFNVMLERLSDSFAARKQFSANVAHELKTPLATMQASVQVLRMDEAPTGEDCLKMLDVVERNTARLRAVIDDLMRLCDEQSQLEREEVSLPKLFSDIFEELIPELEAKHIRAEIDCAQFPVVTGKESLLYRAFFNLVENAVKYGREGGTIRVFSSCEGSAGTIRVRDTGIGIPPEELPHIFEPFYRVNKSRSRKTGGAGLGLAVVKTIIERHGWSISADSTPDIGAEFIIRLYRT